MLSRSAFASVRAARTAVLVVLFLVLAGAPARAAQPSFYLSTDRIFSSRDDVVLRVEGDKLRRLSVRVYRIEEPLAFFTRQENPYQVRGDGERAPEARQLAGLFLSGVRKDVVEGLKQKASYTNLPSGMREGIKDFLRAAPGSSGPEKGGYLSRYPLLRELRIDIPEQKQDWTYHLVRLPIFDKGVYLIEGMKDKEAGYTVAIVSDLALVSRHAADTAVYFAGNRLRGKGEGAKLTLFKPPEAIGGAVLPNRERLALTANAEGFARHGNRAWLDGRVYAYAEGESGVCLHDATFYPSSSFGVSSIKAYIYTERPLYMPGQTVYFRAVLRAYEAGYRLAALARGSAVPIEFYSPSGKLISKTEARAGEFAALSGEWAIPEGAEPGIWRLVVVHDGKRYEAPFKVEQYVKPPFEVTVTTDKGTYSQGEEVRGKIAARYFFGDAVRGADVQYIVYRAERVQSWDAGVPFGWYLQDNEHRNVREERVFEGRGETDGDGAFAFTFNANEKTLRSDGYSYRVEARITDRSRRMVRGAGSFSLVQGRFWLRLEAAKEYFVPGEKAGFSVSAHGYDGGAPSVDYTARVTYFRWNAVSTSEPAEKVVRFEKRFSLPKESKFECTFDDAGHYQIEITAQDSAGNAVTTGQSVWVAGNANTFVVQEGGLRVVADKKLYAQGETAELLTISPVPGVQLLYTIEGDTILESGVLSLEGNSLLRKQRVTERMTPNSWFVLHAIYNDRVYTARHQIIAPPKEKFLNLSVSGLKERYKPGERVSGTVRVTDHAGRGARASLSLAAVDQAIFALQPRMVIDIERFFYHAHRNTVIGASSFYTRFYGYAEEDKLALARHLRQDSGLADLSKGAHQNFNDSARGNFRDLAHWSAEIATDAGGNGNFAFTLPDNITGWDLDLVAADAIDRVGSARSSFISRKDLFIRSVTPTVLYERDEVVVSATAHNLLGTKAEAEAHLRIQNGELLTKAEQKVTIPAQGESLLFWRVRAAKVGNAELEFSLRGAENDTEIQTIEVKPFARRQAQNHAGPLAGKDTPITREFALPDDVWFDDGAAAAKGTRGGLTVRVSPSLVGLVENSLRYLVDYPYGCVEQTLSRFIPNLLVQRLLDEYPFRDPYLREALPEMAAIGLDRLRAMQNQDGSWGWFGGDEPDIFMTAYAVYGLSLAAKNGYWSETEAMLESGAACLREGLRTQDKLDPVVRAFALFALAQQDSEMASMIDAALQATPREERLARVLLANAAFDARLQDLAFRVIEEQIRERAKAAEEAAKRGNNRYANTWREDDNFIDALILRVVARHDTERAKTAGQQMINELLARRQGDAWRSTFDTAFIVSAFLDYARTWQSDPAGADVPLIRINGVALALSREGLGFEAHAGKGELRAGKNVLEVRGGEEQYYNAVIHYVARQESFQARPSPAAVITRSYHLVETGSGGRARIVRELKGALPHGKLVLVRLQVRASRALDYAMIEDPIVAGCEYVREGDNEFVQGVTLNNWLSHQQEADRVAFFQRVVGVGESEICYLIRPFLEGASHVLPASVGSMYYPDTAATSASDRIQTARE